MTYPKTTTLSFFKPMFPMVVHWYNANLNMQIITPVHSESERNSFMAEKDSLLLASLCCDFRTAAMKLFKEKKYNYITTQGEIIKKCISLLYLSQSALSGLQYYIDDMPGCEGLEAYHPEVLMQCAGYIATCLATLNPRQAIQVNKGVITLYDLFKTCNIQALSRYETILTV